VRIDGRDGSQILATGNPSIRFEEGTLISTNRVMLRQNHRPNEVYYILDVRHYAKSSKILKIPVLFFAELLTANMDLSVLQPIRFCSSEL
jgi:hypothetical protein